MVALAILKSWRLAPSTAWPMGMPPPSVRRRRLVPIFPRSVGCLPTCFPPQWGFGHRAVQRQPLPITAFQGLVCNQAALPQCQEDACRRPLLEAAMGGTTGTEVRRMQRLPLAPGTQHEENGIHGLAIIDAGPMAPQWVRLPWGPQRLEACPQLVRHAPIMTHFRLVGPHRTVPCGREFLPTGSHQTSLMG
jgi:hypothetical protein